MKKILAPTILLAFFGCRGCDGGVRQVSPSIAVAPVALDFGKVKAGFAAELPLTISSQSKSALTITAITIEGASADAFSVAEPLTSIAGLTRQDLTVRFKPIALEAYGAELVIESNDPEHAKTRVSLTGEGATPIIAVTPACEKTNRCTGVATISPPAIDFGAEPFLRLLELEVTALPTVSIVNEGSVQLLVSAAKIEGPDAAAFTLTAAFPAEGLPLEAGTGRNLSVRFKPTSEAKQSYQAVLKILSDDANAPEVSVALTGALRPNLPPRVCANVVRVIPGDGSAPINYGTKAQWDLLLVPPPGGYDFTQSRDVQPKSDVTLSALSDAADETQCTNDPEDGRRALVYEWKVLSAPPGSTAPALAGATTPAATLKPFATGEYTVQLTVKDAQGHATSTTLKLAVAIKEDLVAQLSWTGFSDVDLDVHLVRPQSVTDVADPFSGAFSFFEEGAANKTSGDVNGYSAIKQKNTPGFDFEWGEPGTFDDPRLNIDDTGSGQLLENVSLNYPENDPKCAGGSCTYKVMVHYFRDARTAANAGPCTVGGGCKDGELCDCTTPGTRCVANAAPKGTAPTGSGKCLLPPRPVVKIFIKANPVPAKVIPLDTLVPADALAIGAPCQLLHVADVVWPAKGSTTDAGTSADGGVAAVPQVIVRGADSSGRITNPVLARFGFRQANNLQCSPNTSASGVDWYASEP